MSYKLFKPNSKKTPERRSASTLAATKKEVRVLYVSAVLQAGWNSERKIDSFKENAKNPQKTITTKLDEFEVGGMIFVINNLIEWKAYHKSEGGSTQIVLTPFYRDGDKFPLGF